MSIEQALAENTSAIRELIAALRAGIPTTAAQLAAVAAEAPALAQPEAAPAAVSDAAEHGKTGAQAVKALDGHANKPAPAATYENARAAMLSLSKEKGRDAVVAVLSAFGVQKLPDLEPEHYDALVAKVEEARA